MDPKQQYISRLSKTCVYKAGHGVSSCSLWSMPSEHGASSWGIIMGHLYRFMGHHHLEYEHAQANAACNNATSNCSSERPSHVVFHAAHYFGHYFGRFFHAGHQSIVTSMQPLWGVIIWSMSIHKQPCKAACKQPCETPCGHAQDTRAIRWHPHEKAQKMQPHDPAPAMGTAPAPEHPSHSQPTGTRKPQPQPQPHPPTPKNPKDAAHLPTSKVRTPPRRRCLGNI